MRRKREKTGECERVKKTPKKKDEKGRRGFLIERLDLMMTEV